MRDDLRLDEIAGIVASPAFAYRGPWWLLRIPGRSYFARRSWWSWIPAGAEVYAMAEARP